MAQIPPDTAPSKIPRQESALEKLFGKELDITIFYFVITLTVPFLLLGAFWPDVLTGIGNRSLSLVCKLFKSTYLLSVTGFVVFGIAIALSPFGRVRLGKDTDKPDFSTLSWFSMLFSAGMGIGLIFWSIAEPMYHFAAPPTGAAATPRAAALSIEIFFFHWGFHAWGTFVIVGLSMAYFQFRKGQPALISRCLAPLIGERRALGGVGRVVDTFAIWATILGVVTSLGLGAMQITGGISETLGVPGGSATTAVVIGLITCCFVFSAITGIERGIQFLSLLNISLMAILFSAFLLFGPTGHLFGVFGRGIADYLTDLPRLSFSTTLFGNEGWTRSWTVFYWAWWIAWAPFVGAFIARISKGRTIREFVLGVLVAPPLFSFIFATAMGGTALHLDMAQGAGIGAVVKRDVAMALFATLRHLPGYTFLAIVAVALIASFFITSADSATYVVTRFSTQGLDPSDRRAGMRLTIVWGLILGLLAIVLIFSGGLKALQTASIVGALPFLFIMLMCAAAIVVDLVRNEGSS